jgi:hypothetical protein
MIFMPPILTRAHSPRKFQVALADCTDKKGIPAQSRQDAKTETTLCSAIPKNCAFLAKFFLLFVSFVCFCKVLLVAALPRQDFASLRDIRNPQSHELFTPRRQAAKHPANGEPFRLYPAIVRNHANPTRFLPQRNAKNAEIRTYVVFSLRSLRSFAAIHLWLRLAALVRKSPSHGWRAFVLKQSKRR